jgi:hypothetical protein
LQPKNWAKTPNKLTTSIPAAGKVLDAVLDEHLCFLAVRRRRQCHDPKHARADALSDGLDRTPFPAPSRPSNDNDPDSIGLHPLLQMARLDLKA